VKTLLIGLFLISSAWASFPLVKVDNISGTYSEKKGKAFAEHASYDLDVVKIDHKNIEVEFNNIEGNLVLNDPNTTVEINFDFSFLNVFRTIAFNGVNIVSTQKKFISNMNELRVFIEPTEYVLEEVELSSDISGIGGDLKEISILEGLITNGDLGVKTVNFGKIDSEKFRAQVIAENPDVKAEAYKMFSVNESTKSIPVTGRNLRLVSKDQSFSGSLLLDSWINAWFYFGGKVENDPDAKKLYIDLYKAKIGIFSVRGLALRTIRNLNLESVSVEGNRIIVDFGEVLHAKPNDSKQSTIAKR
tara:strand:- start:129449 stop:130357 length:909 start_codon:yes stop_codon:yes gene_type:complete